VGWERARCAGAVRRRCVVHRPPVPRPPVVAPCGTLAAAGRLRSPRISAKGRRAR